MSDAIVLIQSIWRGQHDRRFKLILESTQSRHVSAVAILTAVQFFNGVTNLFGGNALSSMFSSFKTTNHAAGNVSGVGIQLESTMTTVRIVVSSESSAVVVLLSAFTRTSVARNRANTDRQAVSSPWYSRQPQNCSSETMRRPDGFGSCNSRDYPAGCRAECHNLNCLHHQGGSCCERFCDGKATSRKFEKQVPTFGKSRVGRMS